MEKRADITHLKRCTGRRLALLLLPLLCLSAAEAEAAYYRAGRRAFLQIGDLYQRLSLRYDFSNQASSSAAGDSSSNAHYFDEQYTLGFAWVVYNPRILKGQLTLTGKLNQGFTSASEGESTDSSQSSFLYRLEGTLLETKPYPTHFSLFSEENMVSNSFAPSYTISRRGEAVSVRYKNRYLPVSASLSHGSNTISGGGRDTSSDSLTYTLGAGNALKWSDTNATLQVEKQTIDGSGDTVTLDRTTLDIFNTLHREQRTVRRCELTSHYRVREEKGSDPYTRKDLRENFFWELGRGFRLNAAYSVGDDRTDRSRSSRQGGYAGITHTLYQNLRTTLNYSWSDGETTGGESSSRTGGLSLAYSKRLGDDGNLSLGYSYSQTLNEQSYKDATVAVNYEEHTVPPASDLPDPAVWEFSLGQDVVHDSGGDIMVRNADRTWTYTEGVDYEVVQTGADTVIRVLDLPRAGLFPIDYGSTLLVSYRRKVNTQLSATSSSHSVSGSLARQGGRYVIGFDATRTTSEHSGSDTLGQTRDSLSAGVRGTVNLGDTRYYLVLRHTDTAGTVTEMISGTWTHQRSSYYGNLSMTATETYTTSSTSGGSDRWTNTATFAGTYNRTFSHRIGFKLDGRYENRLDDVGMRHRLTVGMDLKTRMGKAWISTGLNSSWSLDDQTTSRVTTFYLNYNRTF